MITKEEKKVIVKAIGKNFIQKIHDFAKAHDRKKENGDLYSKSTFTMVLGGKLPHKNVEKIIFDAAKHYLQLEELEKKKRKELFQEIKTKA